MHTAGDGAPRLCPAKDSGVDPGPGREPEEGCKQADMPGLVYERLYPWYIRSPGVFNGRSDVPSATEHSTVICHLLLWEGKSQAPAAPPADTGQQPALLRPVL